MCRTVEPVDSARLALPPISDFRFRHDLDTVGIDHWMPFIRLKSLRHLAIPAKTRLISLITASDPFPAVTNLTVGWRGSVVPESYAVLSKFPGIQALTIRARVHPDSAPDWVAPLSFSDHLNSLTEYTGPHELLQSLLPIPTLRRVALMQCDEPSDVLARWGPCGVTSLAADFRKFGTAILEDLCRVFPDLTDLHVMVVVPMWPSNWGWDFWDESCRWEVCIISPAPTSELASILISASRIPRNAHRLVPAPRCPRKTGHPVGIPGRTPEASVCAARSKRAGG
jgi:hypothetical protein